MALLRRTILGIAAAVLLLPFTSAVALGSCIQQTLDEQAKGAEVIVVGSVTETRQTFAAASGVIRFRPERVLRGSLTREAQVYLGPSHGGAITSVDYVAVTKGERHTLYLRATADGSYETNACSGSHVGGPTPDEEALLGAGTLVAAASDESVSGVLVAAIVVIFGLVVAAILFLRRRRSAS